MFYATNATQQVTFANGGGSSLVTGGNVISATYPRWTIKSTATSGGNSRSFLDYYDGNNTGWELTSEADGSNAPFALYPITTGTRGSKALNIDNTGAATFAGKVTSTGISTGSAGSANKAVCWKTTTTIGYCSTVVDSSGACTCN